MIKLFCLLKESGSLTSLAFEGASKALKNRLIRLLLTGTTAFITRIVPEYERATG